MSKYLLDFDEIHKFGEGFTGSLSELLDKAYSKMREAFDYGWWYVEDVLLLDVIDLPSNFDSIAFKEIEGKDAFDRLEEAYNDQDIARIGKIMETECHRIFNDSSLERAKVAGCKNKTWITMGDDKVRDTHDYIEGVSVPIDAEFITYDGDSALYPGGFSSAENNVNCRCVLGFS